MKSYPLSLVEMILNRLRCTIKMFLDLLGTFSIRTWPKVIKAAFLDQYVASLKHSIISIS